MDEIKKYLEEVIKDSREIIDAYHRGDWLWNAHNASTADGKLTVATTVLDMLNKLKGASIND